MIRRSMSLCTTLLKRLLVGSLNIACRVYFKTVLRNANINSYISMSQWKLIAMLLPTVTIAAINFAVGMLHVAAVGIAFESFCITARHIDEGSQKITRGLLLTTNAIPGELRTQHDLQTSTRLQPADLFECVAVDAHSSLVERLK